jgi:hypothetical protein
VKLRRRRSLGTQGSDPEDVFKQVRKVEAELRTALGYFRAHLSELEDAIHQSHEEEV